MAKTRKEKIASYEERIAQLENQRKQEIQKMKAEERKARTRRLCSRHGLLEKFMPDLATITDEQFEEFIKRGINTSYGQKILAEIVAKGTSQTENSDTAKTSSQQTENGTAKTPTGAGQSSEQATAKPTGATSQTDTAHNGKPDTTAAQPNGTTSMKNAEKPPHAIGNHSNKPTQSPQRNTAADHAKAGDGTMVSG